MINLTRNPEVLEITEKIRKKHKNGGYLISDIILHKNGREYQFVDLVMEGGGTLGIALVGYIHALEQAGIRFLGMGGSSIGAIVALLTYSCGERTEEKGEKLASIISEMNIGDMLDGRYFARMLSRLLGERGAKFRTARIILSALLALPGFLKTLGLNPGDELFKWISDELFKNNVQTLMDLNKKIYALPHGLFHRETGSKIDKYDTSLKIVVADITTSTKVEFPKMAAMYWLKPNEANPAGFARASASIPAFFQPYTVNGVSQCNEIWNKLASFTGDLPDKVSFADGGLLSNFPIDLFDRPVMPRAPTLGARLGNKRRTAKEVDKAEQYVGQLFKALRHYSDYDFIFKNQLYKLLITHIPTDDYHWLDFSMGPDKKLGLFKEGVEAGYLFLENFDWPRYKELRAAEIALRGVPDQK